MITGRRCLIFIHIQFADDVTPLRLGASSSIVGPIMRHGPHHSAQQSTSTGISGDASRTTLLKLASVTSSGLVAAECAKRKLRAAAAADRLLCFHAAFFDTVFAPQFGQAIICMRSCSGLIVATPLPPRRDSPAALGTIGGMKARRHILHETTFSALREFAPNVAVLPWGATEAHNRHLPHGTDVIEATGFAERSAELSVAAGGRPVVLPAIPFGNNEQQLDQTATISITTATAAAILSDVAALPENAGNRPPGHHQRPRRQRVQADRAGHSARYGMLIVVINFFQIQPELLTTIFAEPGDHGGEMETSLVLHLRGDWVELEKAGPVARLPNQIEGLTQSGVWTPRPWSATHPDTGAGNPKLATAEKGKQYFEAVSAEIAKVLTAISKGKKGERPYL